jgi:hypothetical protein
MKQEKTDTKCTELCINIDDLNINHISFMELVNNKIIDGTFSNIVHTDPCVIINGLYIQINHHSIKTLVFLEEQLINLYQKMFDCSTKKPSYVIKDYFKDEENTKNFIHKIYETQTFKLSGVWESNTNFGLNHKFIKTASFV